MRARHGAGVIAGIIFIAAALPAWGGVDTEVPLPAKVQGAVSEGEVERIRFFAPEGATLQVKLSTKRSSGLDPDLRLLDPDETELPIPVANVADKGTSIKVKKLRLGRSGVWTLEVSGDGAGDYKLAVKAKAPTKLVQELQLGGDPVDVAVPVQFGATLKLSAKTAKGGTVTPVLLSFDGEDLTSEGKRGATSHKVTATAGASGDLLLRLDGEGEPGSVRLTATIKPPKARNAPLDVRGAALGRPAGGETAVGRVIEPAKGGVVESGLLSDLSGAAVAVPPGALTQPTLITVRSTSVEALPNTEDDTNAGPTVEFGPSGLEFSQPVQVTVPIDAQSLPIQATADDITVLVVEDDGSSQELTPSSVDLEAGTVTVAVSGFSRFTAIAPVGSPQLAGRRFWGVSFDARLEPDLSQRDESGTRHVSAAEVLLDFDPDGTSITIEAPERELLFGAARGPNDQLETVYDDSTGTLQAAGTWQYDPDGQRVVLSAAGSESGEWLAVSRDGTILLNVIADPEEGAPEDAILDLLVQRPDVADPTALLLGTYAIGELAVWVEPRADGSLFEVEHLRSFGTVTLRSGGKADFDIVGVSAFGGASPSPGVLTFEDGRERGTTTWVVERSGPLAGTVVLNGGAEPGLRLFPHRDGRMFVMTADPSAGEDFTLIVGVRKSSGRALTELRGAYAGGRLFFRPREYSIEDGAPGSGQFLNVPDFALSANSDRLLFDGTTTVSVVSQSTFYQERATGQAGGVLTVTDVGPPESVGVGLRPDGRLDIFVADQELRGALTLDRAFGFVVSDPDADELGMVLFVNQPPEVPR